MSQICSDYDKDYLPNGFRLVTSSLKLVAKHLFGHGQSDQMATLFVQHLAIYNN